MAWKEMPQQRSYPCNAALLAQLRKRKQLTQKGLADLVGYSMRLISKAESGLPISVEAISHLAEAFSVEGRPVYPEDLIADPLQRAKEYVAAVYTKGKAVVDAIAHFVDEEVVFRIAGDPREIPFAGEHRGIEGMRRAFEIFFSVLEAPEEHNYEDCYTFLADGNEVSMTGESWIHPIGAPLEKPIMIAHRFVFRRGKLILLEDIYDTQSGKDALSKQGLLD